MHSIDVIRLILLALLPIAFGFALPSIRRLELRMMLAALWLLLPVLICGAIFVWTRMLGDPQRDFYGAGMLLAMAIYIFTPTILLWTSVGFAARYAVNWIGRRVRTR